MDCQPLTAYIRPQDWRAEGKRPDEGEKRPHTLNAGKMLGSMYTEIAYKQERLDPVYDAVMDKNLRVFFREYISRLSRTVKMRLADLAEYIDRESSGDVIKAERIISALTSAKGRESPETCKTANFAANLHRNFEHKDSVTCPEFISLLCRYGDIS
jgi:hypothetical protein